MEFLNASTPPPITPAQEWVLPFANELWNVSAAESGWSLSQEEVRRFTLPSPRQSLNESIAREQPGHRILLVEDNVGDARLIREALENSEISGELVVITNGQRAIDFIDEIDNGPSFCPDLAIVDLNLPKRPGTDVVLRMRASSKCKHVPVVVLTSSDNQRDREAARRIGVSRYILKPARLPEILNLGVVFRELLGLSENPAE